MKGSSELGGDAEVNGKVDGRVEDREESGDFPADVEAARIRKTEDQTREQKDLAKAEDEGHSRHEAVEFPKLGDLSPRSDDQG